ncbi:hypothetical protein C9374_005277 [Naegleria lovaniensis]|uniref:START domain-containing protein n=1 Tax=Naegleria lovaniensis TaxID=51637 RepID=A0AA88KIX9_NAELO|nr:uncharacterized protein C9374_005277 [Naegleria lovaniensis]KAG2382697.1 hypothetical protein C9374_005277 [Naegleria lovaniensis]
MPTPDQITLIKQKWNSAKEKALRMTSQESLEDSTFEYHHTKKNVDVYSCKQEGESALVIRGDVICENVTPEEFVQPLLSVDMKIKKLLDPLVKRVELIESWNDEDGEWRILYYVVSAGAPFVSDRDFLYVLRFHKTDSFTYFVSTSIDGIYEPPSSFVPHKGAVRGTNEFVCQRYVPEEGNAANIMVTYSSLTLPNGWIPQSVVNSAIFPVPLGLATAAELLNKKLRTRSNSPSLNK